MTKVIVSVDTVAFDHKPTSKETEDIQRRFKRDIKPRKAEISEIANLFITGHTIRPTDNRGTKNEHFISQRLFACDVDNGYTDTETKRWTISDRVIEPAEHINLIFF